jgi:formate dehydrogenase subunit delta
VNPDKLVKMANQIASFFEAEPDRKLAVASVADHIKRFWDPRMRREILKWTDEHHGEGLKDLAREAIGVHRDKLMGGV